MTYTYVSTYINQNNYRINLSIYEDCLNGNADAIRQDDSALIVVFDDKGKAVKYDLQKFDAVQTVNTESANMTCIVHPPKICITKKSYTFNITLPITDVRYFVTYQRCCRTNALTNVVSPGSSGTNIFCEIPPSSVAPQNTSAVFKNFPPVIICNNIEMTYDNSARDADGDSLSYELCQSYNCPDTKRDEYVAPPFSSRVTIYQSPFSYSNPLIGDPGIIINPVTGELRCKPSNQGIYLVSVCCNEWRNGKIINTIHREFQFFVSNCSRSVVASIPHIPTNDAIYTVECRDFNVLFKNESKGASTYTWDFGDNTPVSNDFEPYHNYRDTGIYLVKLIANPGLPCNDSIAKYAYVFPYLSAAVTQNGKICADSMINFKNASTSTTSPISYSKWWFGDGSYDTGISVNHSYSKAGAYNVLLATSNTRYCTDTTIYPIVISAFRPKLIDDTIIVKGETLSLDCRGGYEYEWEPGYGIENYTAQQQTITFNDLGKYTYVVAAKSAEGCPGKDTTSVWVVNQLEFFVPTAFTPNNDGRNDFIRPIAVGYSTLNYFKIFDRWGTLVYATTDFEPGWDGSFQGKPCEVGVYYYEISAKSIKGNTLFQKGDFTLIR